MSDLRPWVGVDLDGTLAEYDGFQGPTTIGKPIPAMVERVKNWLREGVRVKIFTARVGCPDQSHPDYLKRLREAILVREYLEAWCLEHIGQKLEITCQKDYDMLELWDDRATQVVPNTGQLVVHLLRNLVHSLSTFPKCPSCEGVGEHFEKECEYLVAYRTLEKLERGGRLPT